MFPSAWLCLSLLAPFPGSLSTASPVSIAAALKAYDARKTKTGADAASQVDLALWCEANGLKAERTKHLTRAVLTEPKSALVRGLLGQVEFRGRWDDPDGVRAKILADESMARKLADYNRRRADLAARDRRDVLESAKVARKNGQIALAESKQYWYARKTAPEHVKLGLWCEQNGLKAEAMAHFTQAVVLDPYRDATWKHLGYVKQDGRWVSREQAEADRVDAAAQQKADRYWEPTLRRWRTWLGEKLRAEEARVRLAKLNEPRAAASVMRVFGPGGESDQIIALEILGRIETPVATRHIAGLAVFSPSAKVRYMANGALRRREPRDYVGDLVDWIRSPMKYEVQPVRGPGSRGALYIETSHYKLLRTYDAPPAFQLTDSFFGYVGYDANGLPVVIRGRELDSMAKKAPAMQAADLAALEARTQQLLLAANVWAEDAQKRLIADIDAIETQNAAIVADNPRISRVLKSAADAPADLKDDDEIGWHKWWFDKLGYTYESPAPAKPEILVNVSPSYPPPPAVYSCFAAGTPVRTRDGRKPIESLLVGDQVLAQDVTTGSLGFHPVTVVHHNAPSATIRLALDNGDALVASVYHRFWCAGIGWKLARELKPGDTLRTFAGLARVLSTEPGSVVPVYNLDIAGARTFFVGNHDALVHDNTLPDARQKPFDMVVK
ncbi:MAG: polymorphic toxin-type HINT domain-containing protein [Isosphaeraceae bacterium]